MEESPKSPANGAVAGNIPEFLDETDFDGELLPEFPIKEEMIEEVMQELYKEITCSASSSTCTSTESPSTVNNAFPSSAPSPVFVDNGRSESCGASVSDSALTVMAGVEFVGKVAGRYGGRNVGCSVEEEKFGCDYGDGFVMDGCGDDQAEFGAEWLDRVMGWGPLEVEGWT